MTDAVNPITGDRERLFSVRMHGGSESNHLCGAERIVYAEGVRQAAGNMIDRAIGHVPEGLTTIRIQVEAISSAEIRRIPLLPVRTLHVSDSPQAHAETIKLLLSAGVCENAAASALGAILRGASPRGRNMRGAMIINAVTGERLEPDSTRGVRVSRMDVAQEARSRLKVFLQDLGLAHPRVMEAVLLASKVAAIPDVMAEVCCSDDPEYTTGYVASKVLGYVRIPGIKQRGDAFGGRAFFVKSGDALPGIIRELEEAPYLVSEIPHV
jgi:6-carboxyhexanoate--CoA ligase